MKENSWAYILLWEYRQSISKQLYGQTYGNKFSGKKTPTFIRKKEVLVESYRKGRTYGDKLSEKKKKTTFIRKKEVLCREFQEGLIDEGAFEGTLERSEE